MTHFQQRYLVMVVSDSGDGNCDMAPPSVYKNSLRCARQA
jgi:hypothetical protein